MRPRKTLVPDNGKLTYLDLFSGAGGLSEGFILAGFDPVAHVEIDAAACNTLKTRASWHWLNKQGRQNTYYDYLHGKLSRSELYAIVPEEITASVINAEIGHTTLKAVFKRIDDLLGNRRLDLVVGGPPCQAYSLVGRARDKNGMQGDRRNFLYRYYAEFLKRYKPQYFVFENVLGLLSARSKEGVLYIDDMITQFRKAGYETEFRVLSAYDYGVPQNRKRVILIGKKGSQTGFYPEFQKSKPDILVKDVLADLPGIKAGEGAITPCKLKHSGKSYLYDIGVKNDDTPVTWHISRPHSKQDLEIYEIALKKWNQNQERLNYNDLPNRLKTHNNREAFTDRFKVVAGDLPYSHTVVAHISKDGHYYIHPDIKQTRSLTPREAARLQTFPDDYFFESVSEKPGRTAAFTQIGNAVPVLLAQMIAKNMKGLLS